MRSLVFVLPTRATVTLTPTLLLALAATVVAALLLTSYVGLLHEAVGRRALTGGHGPSNAPITSRTSTAPVASGDTSHRAVQGTTGL